MVKVNYLGRLGNNMFQYAMGRHLAQEMNYALGASPLPFPRTREEIRGQAYYFPRQVLNGHHCDVPAVLGRVRPRAIVLDGFFQQSWHYLPIIKEIRTWFDLPIDRSPELKDASPRDLLIYIRLGDYYTNGDTLTRRFYEEAIRLARPRRVFIATEEPGHPYLADFAPYQPTILCSGDNAVYDLCAARFFGKIAISCSSFSWWAAMLAEGAEVYVPLARTGRWSGCNLSLRDEASIDLRVDEARFTYLYNSPILASPKSEDTLVPLPEIRPGLMPAHRHSRAFWFAEEALVVS